MAGAAAGGFVNGLAGFGVALFALGFLLTIMTPIEAVAITAILSVTNGLQGVWVVRQALRDNPARLARFLIPGLVGVPLGITLLKIVQADTLKLVIALFLMAYGGYFSFLKKLPSIAKRRPLTDCAVGFSGGVMGGAASLSGAFPTMWCALRGWPKAETRAVLQPFNVTILGVTTTLLIWEGAYHRETLLRLAIAVPAALLAAQIGISVFHRLSDRMFSRLLVALCFASGALLLVRTLT
ncbi:MAG: sulfite exporter TauE/SafE family protein [Pseudomonadota bacterium]